MNKIIDNDSIYSYKGYTIHQTRDQEGELQEEIVIKKNGKIVKKIEMARNVTIKAAVELVENAIDNI